MDNQLIQNVRHLMGDMKQEPYAKAVGVNQSSISRLLRGEVSPSIDTVRAIAHHHGYSIDALVEADLTTPHLTPATSQPVQLDRTKLAVALVAVEKSMRSMGMDPAESWGSLARLVIWALDLQDELYPAGINGKADQLGFDAQVERELRNGGYYGFGSTEQDAGGGNARRSKAQANGPQAGDRGKRGNP